MTTTTTNTTSQYDLGSAQYCSGSIMDVTHDARDNAIDVTYFTKPERRCYYFKCYEYFHNYTTTRVLKLIINNTVRPI